MLEKTRKITIAVRHARAGRIARGLIGALDFLAESAGCKALVGESLQGAHRADQFRGIGGGVGQRILGPAGQRSHPSSERDQGQHDQRDHRDHGSG
jgi:hypothetical protein